MGPAQTYVEWPPVLVLSDLVRVAWIQQIGAEPYTQRNLPTGGVELHFPLGSRPRLVGPLTGPSVEVLGPGTTVLGVRFRPGAAPLLGLPARELVDLTLNLDEIWGPAAGLLAERMSAARTPQAALLTLQGDLAARRAGGVRPDPVVPEAVRRLMPWQAGGIRSLSEALAISESQLRRRFLDSVGTAPKALQRTLRFQGFLALVQHASGRGRPAPKGGLAALAAEAGYADHAHLCRECLRLTGLPPRAFLEGRCGCGHDHSASFVPFLRARPWPVPA